MREFCSKLLFICIVIETVFDQALFTFKAEIVRDVMREFGQLSEEQANFLPIDDSTVI